ncbi:MAG: hypothetical protein ACT4NU_06110 [Chromatiales bacterium]
MLNNRLFRLILSQVPHLAVDPTSPMAMKMIFSSRSTQTLFSALLDAVEVHGRESYLLEDVNREEQSYGGPAWSWRGW